MSDESRITCSGIEYAVREYSYGGWQYGRIVGGRPIYNAHKYQTRDEAEAAAAKDAQR